MTDPDPITTLLPIVTPGLMTVFPPIHTSFPIVMGNAYSYSCARNVASIGCPAVNKLTLGANNTLFPIVTLAQSSIVQL